MFTHIRPMNRDDVPGAETTWRVAFPATREDADLLVGEQSQREIEWERAPFLHLLSTDPNGSFVAEAGGEIVGICQSIRREGDRFVLCRLAVTPELQERGVGRSLLERALGYAEGSSEQYIWSSKDPRAMHSYVREGFALHPTMQITGHRRTNLTPDSMGIADDRGLEFACVIDSTVRAATRRDDLLYMLGRGGILITDDDGGYFVATGNRLSTLCATSVPVAQRLLEAALSGGFGLVPLEVYGITAGQQWAFESAVRCGATLENKGAMMTRNVATLPYSYIPNRMLG